MLGSPCTIFFFTNSLRPPWCRWPKRRCHSDTLSSTSTRKHFSCMLPKFNLYIRFLPSRLEQPNALACPSNLVAGLSKKSSKLSLWVAPYSKCWSWDLVHNKHLGLTQLSHPFVSKKSNLDLWLPPSMHLQMSHDHLQSFVSLWISSFYRTYGYLPPSQGTTVSSLMLTSFWAIKRILSFVSSSKARLIVSSTFLSTWQSFAKCPTLPQL